MWRPDRSLHGPDPPTLRDIEPLNRVFAEAFTDRYSPGGIVGVRVPHLNTLVWRYALEDAGQGAMVWRDADWQMVAFNIVHQSDVESWMGPLAVRPDHQGGGLGSTMVRLGIDWLKGQGARTIVLETMPRTVENIGFYSRPRLALGLGTPAFCR
jgi:GNAT superfamily N-acetyltransferase